MLVPYLLLSETPQPYGLTAAPRPLSWRGHPHGLSGFGEFGTQREGNVDRHSRLCPTPAGTSSRLTQLLPLPLQLGRKEFEMQVQIKAKTHVNFYELSSVPTPASKLFYPNLMGQVSREA